MVVLTVKKLDGYELKLILTVCYRWPLTRDSNRGTRRFNSIDICSDDHSDSKFGRKENLQFSPVKGQLKFLNTEKLIPFVFRGTNMSLKIRKGSVSIFVKPTTAGNFIVWE